jgi:hypothetical protein
MNFLVKKLVIIYDKATWTRIKYIVIYLMQNRMSYEMGRREVWQTGTKDSAGHILDPSLLPWR